MSGTSVLIVEDHPLFSKGLADLILSHEQFKLAGIAENCVDALELLRKKKPDLAIIDLVLGEEDGLDLIKNMKVHDPDLLMLVLSMHDERFYSERALHAGARGYIMKTEKSSEIMKAINTVLAGKVYLSERERERLVESMAGVVSSGDGDEDKREILKRLSDRQFQIFTMLGKGLGTIEISARLNLSTKTIDTHKEHMKLKLHCNSSLELRQLAIELKDQMP